MDPLAIEEDIESIKALRNRPFEGNLGNLKKLNLLSLKKIR